VVGKLEGECEVTLAYVDLLRDDFIEKERSCGIFSLRIEYPCQVLYRWFQGVFMFGICQL
jgi:hypothetical protein